MARKARLFVPGAIYHVYCCTASGERVFSADAEALRGYGRTTSEARRLYLACIRAVAEAIWLRNRPRHLAWWAGARDDETIAEPHDLAGPVGFDGEPMTPDLPAVDLRALAERFCRSQGVELDSLAGHGRAAQTIEARIALTAVAVQHFENAVSAIAHLLNKNAGTVSRWLAIARARQRVDPTYRKDLATITDIVVQLHNAAK